MHSRRYLAAAAAVCCFTIFASANTVYFSTEDQGVKKSIDEWGVCTAWPSADNMRQNITHMGLENIDVVRVNFYVDEPLESDGTLGSYSRWRLNNQLNIAQMAGDKPITMLPNSADETHAWYRNGPDEVWPDRWAQVIEATKAYIDRPVVAVEPFNEPDYWDGQGTRQNLYDILTLLRANPDFAQTDLQGASTLSSGAARWWYDYIADVVDHGTLHQLHGSATNYVTFIRHVQRQGDLAYNPELHSLAEAIYGAEHGMYGGIWWGAVYLPRGLFVRASDGYRLGYAENRGNYSAAAVYRCPEGNTYGFAGCFERQGHLTPFRFVSTDRDVYFNGVGPIREYMLSVDQDEHAYIDIDLERRRPALDGNRWKIVNRHSGQVMEVVNAGTQNGADIRQAADTDSLNQKWDIVRLSSGYFQLFAAHSGRTAEVANWSTSNRANIRQWGRGDNLLQSWFIEEADDGYFYIRNSHSCKYMTIRGSNIVQDDYAGSHTQQWEFVCANPEIDGSLYAHYEFAGDVSDSAGNADGTAHGQPQFTAGQVGQAISLDGQNDYVTLPTGVADTDDLTVAAWVKWNGGGNWQRIFDFGNSSSQYMFLSPHSGDQTMRFAIRSGDSGEQILDTDPLPTGQWVHLAVTLSGNTGIMFVDGRARVAGQIRLNPSDFNPANNYIGRSQFPDPLFNGMIDDFRIYDYALDPEQVMSVYLQYNIADITQSGRVDMEDLAVLAGQWLDVPGQPSADIAPLGGDGFVDMLDLQKLVENWLAE